MACTLLFLHEVAEITRVPLSSVRRWVATGRLPSLRPGRRRLVRAEDLAAMLRASERPARVERTSEHSSPPAATVAALIGQVDEDAASPAVEREPSTGEIRR